jgi:putative methionine-R-sulfoxide reductase with GAF domain
MDTPDRWTDSLHLAPVIDEQLDATLTRVSNLAVAEIPGCDMAGITLIRDGKPVTAAFTDPEAPEIDTAQYASGEGPCLDAFRHNKIYTIADTRSETRWLAFTECARSHGILSTLSLPLLVNRDALGALNLYSRTSEAFFEEDTPMLFAMHAAVVLANAQAYWAAHALSNQLQVALSSRSVIERAKGIVMARFRCSDDDAFARIAKESQNTNTKLRDVAQAIIASVVDDSQQTGGNT